MAGANADTVEDAVIATLINRAMEVVTPGQDLVEFEGRSQVIDKRGEIIWER